MAYAPVQVGAGGAARGADAADNLTLDDALALFDRDGAHVGIDAVEAMPVVDHQRLAGEEHVAVGQRDDAVGGGLHRRSLGGGHVHAGMGTSRFPV